MGCMEASGSPSWPEDERQQGPPGGDRGEKFREGEGTQRMV